MRDEVEFCLVDPFILGAFRIRLTWFEPCLELKQEPDMWYTKYFCLRKVLYGRFAVVKPRTPKIILTKKEKGSVSVKCEVIENAPQRNDIKQERSSFLGSKWGNEVKWVKMEDEWQLIACCKCIDLFNCFSPLFFHFLLSVIRECLCQNTRCWPLCRRCCSKVNL